MAGKESVVESVEETSHVNHDGPGMRNEMEAATFRSDVVAKTDSVQGATVADGRAEDFASENAELLKQLEKELLSNKLYADSELNLQRLARKAGIPPRAVSRAINASTGLNMSQWVNNARIEAACELLQQSQISIGQAMFEVGFTTKSNFNREFKRITGQSPSEWRRNH